MATIPSIHLVINLMSIWAFCMILLFIFLICYTSDFES